MKWLPKEKRNPFIVVVLITATALALICFGLIASQKATLVTIGNNKRSAVDKLQHIKDTINQTDANQKKLADLTFALNRAEADMASGDYYAWTVDTMNLFKKQYKVEIPEVGHPSVGDVQLFPAFPYKQIRFSINGKAYYHDLGRFIADFENAFPHARVVNLNIDASGGDGEKIAFRMDVIVLVKPS